MRIVSGVVLALALLATAQAAEVLCVLKQFDGTVRVSHPDGSTENAARGALYAGDVLKLDSGAEVTLIVGKSSVDLGGPLELPVCAAVVSELQDGGGASLLERLALLLPQLADGGAYVSGATRGDGPTGEPFRLLGPRGDVLLPRLRFEPLGDPAACTLRLRRADGTPVITLTLAAEQAFSLADLPPGQYAYEYQTGDPATRGGWPPVEFTLLPEAERSAVAAQLPPDSDALGQVSTLAALGYPYDAFCLAAEALEVGTAGELAPLLASLRDRLGATLLGE